MSESPSTISKDLEGVSDTFDQPPPPPPAGGAAGTKQRKIAVLTSGGDSAGMNAAGESTTIRNEEKRADTLSQFEQSFVKVSLEDARHSSFEKDGKDSFEEIAKMQHPLRHLTNPLPTLAVLLQ